MSGKPFEKNLGRQNTCNPGMKVMTCGWPTDRNLEFRSIGVASSNMSWSKTDSFSLQVSTDLLVSLMKCEVYNFLRLPQPNKKMKHPKLVVLFGFDSRMQGFTTLTGTTMSCFPRRKTATIVQQVSSKRCETSCELLGAPVVEGKLLKNCHRHVCEL